MKIQVTPINWNGIKEDAINLSLYKVYILVCFFVTKGILFRESFLLSPLMVKLKIRVTPNDHRFALLCHCRAVGTMNREGREAIAPPPLSYFGRYVNPISIKGADYSPQIFRPSYSPVSFRRRCGDPTRCNSS